MIFNKVIKRTKGKLNAEVGLKDFYKEYCREAAVKKRSPLTYVEYTKVLKAFNQKVSTKIVYESESFKLPYKLGLLGIIKFEQNFDPDKKYKWAVDWKLSKQHNKIVYFENTDRYKWRWDKSYTRFKGKKYYAFKATKINNRLITKAKQENPRLDYYTKLAP